LNLLLNAMDSTGELPVERRKVTVRAQHRANIELEVAVIDSGPGIAPERLDSVFKPFFTTKPGGLGLGLSITRMIVEEHGGLIWAENNAGTGANFRFTLPLAEETAAA
jgi:signal transduction histidine kinase